MDELSDPSPTSSGEIKPAKKEDYFVELSEGHIHSKYHPRREARRRIPDPIPEPSRYLVLGAGLGYILDELAQQTDGAQVLLFEPHEKWLEAGKERSIWDPDDLAELKVVSQINSQTFETIGSFLHLGAHHRYSLIPWESYQQLEPDFFKQCMQKFKKIQNLQDESLAVLSNQGPNWVRHTRKNLPRFPDTRVPEWDTYDGDIALVSAGPSLDKQKQWLRQHRDQLLFICGNTAGPIFRGSAEITPDIHVAVDTNEPVRWDLESSTINHLWMSTFLDPDAVSAVSGDLSFLAIRTPVTEWMTTADFLPTLNPGGSISSTIIHWIHNRHPGNLYLLGCDMETRYGRYYARGTERESRQLDKLSRFRTLPEWHLVTKPHDDDNNPLKNERDWFLEQARNNQRLRIPNHPPSWWNGPVDNSPPVTRSTPFTHRPAQPRTVLNWFQQQHEQFQAKQSGRQSTPGWNSFFRWIEQIFDNPEQELQAWDNAFCELSNQTL